MSRYPAKLSVLSLAWRGSVETKDEQLLGFTMLNVDRRWSSKSDDYLISDRAYITFDTGSQPALINSFVSALRDDAVLAGNLLSTDLPRLACYANRTDPVAFSVLIEKLHNMILQNGLLDAHKILPSRDLPDIALFALMSELVHTDVEHGSQAISAQNAAHLAAYLRERNIAIWAFIMSLMLSPSEQEFALRCLNVFRNVNMLRDQVRRFGRGDDD